MKRINGDSPSEDVFEGPDGKRLDRGEIVYFGWKEGGVEQDGDTFLVDGDRFVPVDDGESE